MSGSRERWPLPSHGVDKIRSQGHPLDVKVKQNDVRIVIFSASNCVIYLFIVEDVFAMCYQSQCQN